MNLLYAALEIDLPVARRPVLPCYTVHSTAQICVARADLRKHSRWNWSETIICHPKPRNHYGTSNHRRANFGTWPSFRRHSRNHLNIQPLKKYFNSHPDRSSIFSDTSARPNSSSRNGHSTGNQCVGTPIAYVLSLFVKWRFMKQPLVQHMPNLPLQQCSSSPSTLYTSHVQHMGNQTAQHMTGMPTVAELTTPATRIVQTLLSWPVSWPAGK